MKAPFDLESSHVCENRSNEVERSLWGYLVYARL